MEWLVSSVWKLTKKKKKNHVYLNSEGVFEAEVCLGGFRRKQMHLWQSEDELPNPVVRDWASPSPDANAEEELIKDYDTADSQVSINNLMDTFPSIYSMCGDI